ncbi:MAG: hypothetical protein LBP23_06670 [Treponema sp.]|jgi:hypothetical protein|nr:hypothetical protein [Treponema sp.]
MALPDWWSKLKEGGARVFAFAAAARRRLGELLPGGRGRVFIGFGVLLAALLVFLLILLAVPQDGPVRGAAAPAPPVRSIPPEDIFLPEEPDFVPSFIPGRERRESWTEEDAAVYWKDPLKGAEEVWRSRIEAVVDGILEHVP